MRCWVCWTTASSTVEDLTQLQEMAGETELIFTGAEGF